MSKPAQTYHAEKIFLTEKTLEDKEFFINDGFLIVSLGDENPSWFPLHQLRFIRNVEIVKAPQSSGQIRFF